MAFKPTVHPDAIPIEVWLQEMNRIPQMRHINKTCSVCPNSHRPREPEKPK